ncbi:response regulator receiver modulated metal-depenent phosphohydrolase [Geothrix limicola]|uniref:Response regulator receiver modulated metal-depenent phosphohydrolase n=1 Tax=Geothrix limicola TaxID=2927978 RepID=A0ABQ5QC30_9BACT|nr:HD domain-containing phosphohydrolase [Geothrix limicola]GLH71968.1 response regulator receiver modulated metal-depenent phosphohydrolase [Geothrix limicola]
MSAKVLLVDDEENILQGYHRVLRSAFELDTALGGVEALRCMDARGPYAVMVVDMRMPGMSGLDLLEEARVRFPDTTRIMLTGNSDQKTAMDAVNHGQVFRFLTKPCPAEDLELAIRAGLRQYQLVRAEKELLEQTLTGAITVLSELLAGVDPVMFSRSQVVRERAARLARDLGCEEVWAVEIAALLAPIGRVALPAWALKEGSFRTGSGDLLAAFPEVGARLLQPIPRLEGAARIIRYLAKGFDGSGLPEDDLRGEALPLGSRILKVVWDFTELEQARQSATVALEEMRLRPKAYDPRVLEAFGTLLAIRPKPPAARDLRLRDLRAGMTLASDLCAEGGGLVLPAELRLGAGHLELLSSLARLVALQEPVSVRLPDGASHEA